MNNFAAIVASLVLALPAAVGGGGAAPDEQVARSLPDKISFPEGEGLVEQPFAELLQRYEPESSDQVRIEQRVVIRVAPARRIRQDLIADIRQGEAGTRFQERPMKRCVAMANIAGVQSGPRNRLILFMRDRNIVSAALEKTCSVRDFYSGFYVERSEDGLLCSGRDMLQSRTGASCGVQRMAHLVAVKGD
jgi:hypothetical protein